MPALIVFKPKQQKTETFVDNVFNLFSMTENVEMEKVYNLVPDKRATQIFYLLRYQSRFTRIYLDIRVKLLRYPSKSTQISE